MGLEIYAERPLSESIACDTVSAGVAAVITCVGARALMSEKDGQRELKLVATLAIAVTAYAASWLVDIGMRRVFAKRLP